MSPIEDHYEADVLRPLVRKAQGEVSAERKAEHSQGPAGHCRCTSQVFDGIINIRICLFLVRLIAQIFGFLDGSGKLAVIEIRCKGGKAFTGKPVTQILDEGIQPPPGMEYQDAWTFADFGHSKIAFWRNN